MLLRRQFLNNPTSIETIRKLANCNKLPAATAYVVGKLHSIIEAEYKQTQYKYYELLKEHAIMEEGKPKLNEKGEPTFDSKEKENFYDACFTELMDETFDTATNPLPVTLLNNAELSGRELASISEVLRA